MLKKQILTAFVYLFLSTCVFAQQRTVTGNVKRINGDPIPQATIQEKGASSYAVANEQGEFLISVAGNHVVLEVTAIGYVPQQISIGNKTFVEIVLQAGSGSVMEEVVVTAMGIKKEKRSLGYTTQTVDAGSLTENRQTNIVNALQGKVSGVNISSTGGAPGQGSRIIIRGINSLDPSRGNQPIFIVDGVEIDNSTYTTGGGDTRGMTNRAADINPDDVETVTVLRGGAATALYGIRAANGAIVITTKSAKSGKVKISYTGSVGIDKVNKTPEVQMKFSQGYLGVYDKTSFWPSWGPTVEDAKKLDNTHPDQIFNNFERAYRTGYQTRHTVNATGGTDIVQLGTSLSYNYQQGVIPFSDYTSYNGRVFGNINVSPKLKIGASVNFINSGGSRVNSDRYGEQLIYWSPRWDVMDYIKPDGTQKNYGVDNDNPVYTLATNRFFDNVNRTIAGINFQYSPFKWLNFTYRFGNDFFTDNRKRYAPGPSKVVGELVNSDNGFGFVQEHDLKNRIITSTFIANINKDIGEAFNINLNVGHDLRDAKLRRVSTVGDTLDVYNLYILQNAKRITASNYIEDNRIYGFFGDLTLGYKNWLFLNVTGRNDYTSTLSRNNRSYFYPSVSLSYIFTEMFANPSWFSYGKLKLSYASVAKPGDPYSTTTGYSPSDRIDNNIVPWTYTDALGNPNLKPEYTNTYEGGLELRFFKNRLGIDFTLYKANSKDLIVPVKVSNATGFESSTLNAGEIENKGFEITLTAKPVVTRDISWDFVVNFSRNKSRVIELHEQLSEILILSQFGYLSSNAVMKLIPGYQYGALFGRTYTRYYGTETDDKITLREDLPLLIGTNGFPSVNTSQRFLGNSEPKYIASTLQTIRYKNLSLSALVDVKKGMYKYNQFANFMSAFGVAKFTEDRTESKVFDGVLADGSPNTKVVYLGQGTGPDGVNYGNGYYRNVYRGVTENFVEDASWVRLRSLTLTYGLPQRVFKNSKTISAANISLTGNNLWLKTKFSGFDPESSSFSSGSNAANGFSGFTYPGLRSFILTLNVEF